MNTEAKGRFTFRFAAACFALSAVFELVNLQDATILFGHILGTVPTAAYHVIYAALFAWLAVGLWKGTRSGYYALLVTTIFYTVDRLQAVIMSNALVDFLRQQVAEYPQVSLMVSVDDLAQIITMTTLAILVCWWGFVAYAYCRRDYFGIPRSAR